VVALQEMVVLPALEEAMYATPPLDNNVVDTLSPFATTPPSMTS